MTEEIKINLPRELIQLSGLSPELLEEKNLLIWVLELYSEGKITLSKAAQILKISTDKFLEEFYKRRLKRIGGPQSQEEAEEDLRIAQTL